jgi:hypothetical protein
MTTVVNIVQQHSIKIGIQNYLLETGQDLLRFTASGCPF